MNIKNVISRIAIVASVSSCVCALSMAHAETVYAFSITTGELYTYDTDTSGPIVPVGAVDGAFLTRLDTLNSNQNIDLTYFGGYVYGLVSGYGGTSAVFRVDPQTGLEDTTYGTNGILNVTRASGITLTNVAAEGITNDGNDLIISYAGGSNDKRSNILVKINALTGKMFGPETDILTIASSTSIPLGIRDVDGIGRCGSRVVNVNTEDNNDVYIRDMGAMDAPVYEPMSQIVDPTTKPVFYDVAFTGSSDLVVAGRFGGNDNQLHFYTINNSGAAILSSSVTIPGADKGVTSVASTGEANCTIPEKTPPPNYQCYDLMDHEVDTYDSQINRSVIDQFAANNVRIGHPVSICNPVDLTGQAVPGNNEHLVCYERHSTDDTPMYSVEVNNEFETNQLITGEPDEICLVSTKKHL